jgi:hypothetical protein
MASKKLVCDVFDAVMVDNVDGSVAGTTTLQNANIDVAVSEQEVRAGKGNALQANLHVQRDINIDLTDVEWKPEWVAKQLGTDIVVGADVGYAMPKWYEATTATGVVITLDKEPLASENGLVIYNETGTLIDKESYTVAAKVVTFTTGVTAGDMVEVRTYKYATPATTQVLTFESDKFSRGVTLILSTFETDEDENHPFELQYQFPSAVPTGSFQINTSSEKNAATQSLQLKIVKPVTSTVVGKLLRIPLSEE